MSSTMPLGPNSSPLSYANVVAKKTDPDMEMLNSAMQNLNCEQKPAPKLGKRIKQISNAHQDDIHVLVRLSSGNILSGSKDGSLKVWSCNKNIECVYERFRENKQGYRYWITAATAFDDGVWVSGTRDGLLSYFSDSGDFLFEADYQSPTAHKCKDRNINRINCLTPVDTGAYASGLFVGMPCFFRQLNTNGHCQSFTQTSQNDWVYCLELLQPDIMAVVTGSELSLFSPPNNRGRWIQGAPLIREEGKRKSRQRPHISSICNLGNNKIVSADFCGKIKTVDYVTGNIDRIYDEHVGRAWKVVKIEEKLFASCADDGSVKIWDIRADKSMHTFSDFPGRVSNLLYLDDQQVLVTGSCPDDIRRAVNKAQLDFIEIR